MLAYLWRRKLKFRKRALMKKRFAEIFMEKINKKLGEDELANMNSLLLDYK